MTSLDVVTSFCKIKDGVSTLMHPHFIDRLVDFLWKLFGHVILNLDIADDSVIVVRILDDSASFSETFLWTEKW